MSEENDVVLLFEMHPKAEVLAQVRNLDESQWK